MLLASEMTPTKRQVHAPSTKNRLQHRSAGHAAEIITDRGQSEPADIDPTSAIQLATQLAVSETGEPGHRAVKAEHHLVLADSVTFAAGKSSEEDDLVRLRRRRPWPVDAFDDPLAGSHDLLRRHLKRSDVDS
jgi:hypothetical protein